MAANTSPIFTLLSNCGGITINSANTARNGSGTLIDCFTASTNGTLLYRMSFTNTSPTVGAGAAKVIRVWITDTSGANPKLIKEIVLAAATSSNTVIGQNNQWVISDGLFLKSGQKIQVTQSLRATAADNTDVVWEAGDY